jgi:Fur family ferric uptake transcriptional regulator
MREGQRHAWTLEELHARLAQRGFITDFSSVFRAAEKLTAGGVTRKFLLDDGRTRFELVGGHHDHLFCTRCHQVVPVPCVFDRADFAALERETGASIQDHQVILSGLCRNCRVAPADDETMA